MSEKSKPVPSHYSDHESVDSLSKLHLRLWLRLLKSVGLVESEIRKQFREEFSTTLPRFDVMSALCRLPEGLKMSEISAHLRVSNGNVTGIVDRLIEEGLAIRVAKPGDRRANLIYVTPKGRKSFEEQALAHERWIDEMLGSMDAGISQEMVTRLDDLIHILEQKERG